MYCCFQQRSVQYWTNTLCRFWPRCSQWCSIRLKQRSFQLCYNIFLYNRAVNIWEIWNNLRPFNMYTDDEFYKGPCSIPCWLFTSCSVSVTISHIVSKHFILDGITSGMVTHLWFISPLNYSVIAAVQSS